MRLLRLELRNYRNYRNLDLDLGGQLNLFLGANGQGKTNLLESIALLALSASPRTRREIEQIGPLAPEARVTGRVEGGGRRHEVRIDLREEAGRGRKRIAVDELPRRAFDLPGIAPAVLFWPEDLNLVKAGPEHRRRFLNQMLVQVEPGHARLISRYARILEQRNHLLKQIAAGETGIGTLDAWDEELVSAGGAIAEARRRAVAELAPLAARHHRAIAAGEELSVAYLGPPPELAEAVQNSRGLDVRRGLTGVGPHRDDLWLELGGRDARAFASQGQQRTLVVSLKLAEADLVAARSGEPPILLLDDVLSELDADRRQALLERVGVTGQVVVTSAEAAPLPLELMHSAHVHCIRQGELSPCG
ncbi:MAG TPA: DNA replication/repair protein RecF [Candidatus Dormibacteraeota bacterium]